MKGIALPMWAFAVLIVAALAAIIIVLQGSPFASFTNGVWNDCVTQSSSSCNILASNHVTVNAVSVSSPANSNQGIPDAVPGNSCSVAYGDVWIYNNADCPNPNNPNCAARSVTWSGTVDSNYICTIAPAYDIGCGGCTYQRYYNQPIVVSVTSNPQPNPQPNPTPQPTPPIYSTNPFIAFFQMLFNWIRGLLP